MEYIWLTHCAHIVCVLYNIYINSHIITLIVIYLIYTHIKPKSELGLVVKYFIKLIKIHYYIYERLQCWNIIFIFIGIVILHRLWFAVSIYSSNKYLIKISFYIHSTWYIFYRTWTNHLRYGHEFFAFDNVQLMLYDFEREWYGLWCLPIIHAVTQSSQFGWLIDDHLSSGSFAPCFRIRVNSP